MYHLLPAFKRIAVLGKTDSCTCMVHRGMGPRGAVEVPKQSHISVADACDER